MVCKLFLGSTLSTAQVAEKIYLDRGMRPTSPVAAKYYCITAKPDSAGLYPARWYNLRDRLVQTGSYSNLDSFVKHGHFVSYDSIGTKISEGTYKHDRPDGEWREYYAGTGALRAVVRYSAGEVKDSLLSYYPNGRLKRRESYTDSRPDGGIYYDSAGNKMAYTPYFVMPQYRGGMPALNAFLAGNLVYPKDARRRGIEGRPMASFFVSLNGEVTDLAIIQSVYPSLDAEVLRVVKNMRDWIPGMVDGEPCTVSYRLPVRFSLD